MDLLIYVLRVQSTLHEVGNEASGASNRTRELASGRALPEIAEYLTGATGIVLIRNPWEMIFVLLPSVKCCVD